MDADRFDSLSRRLTAVLPRRNVISTLTAATVAGSLALFGLTEIEARRKRHKRRKKRRRAAPKCSPACSACQTCQSGQCTTVANGTPCGNGMVCIGGACATAQGTCAAGEDNCVSQVTITCNGDVNCACYATTTGATICGAGTSGACATCEQDEECVSMTGAGSRCVPCPSVCGTGKLCVPLCHPA